VLIYRAVVWPILKLKTRWNARKDALRDIPGPDQVPSYLEYLATWVQSCGTRLAARWARLDQRLTANYCRSGLRYTHAQAEVSRKRELEAEALLRYQEWSAQPTRKALEKARKALRRAIRTAERAQDRLEHAIGRRMARWQLLCSELDVFLADYKRLTHLYAAVHLRYRETNERPNVLMADRAPVVEIPVSLQKLNWDYQPDEARAGRPPHHPAKGGLTL